MTTTNDLPEYKIHTGTVLISKSTLPNKAARCVERYIADDKNPIELFYIGANAGQQAMKTMGIVTFNTLNRTDKKMVTAFVPRRVKTYVEADQCWKDATVWKLHLLETNILDE